MNTDLKASRATGPDTSQAAAATTSAEPPQLAIPMAADCPSIHPSPAAVLSPAPIDVVQDDKEWEEENWPSTPPEPPLVAGDAIRQVHIRWLKPHPFSDQIYCEAVDKNLVESIRRLGVLEPLQVTVDGVVISGHRRLAAAKETCLKTVSVHVVRPGSLPGAVEEQILEANRARVKNNEQKVREFLAYHLIETARAKARNGYRWDLVPNSARGDAEPISDTNPYRRAELDREIGKARDLAAKKAGMAGSTAADGAKVVEAIDRLWAEAKYPDYQLLRGMLLHKSIRAALKLGLERGWIAKPAPKSRRADQAAAEGDEEQLKTRMGLHR